MKSGVVVAFPRHWPFSQFDFFPQPSFLVVDGAPVALFSTPAVLVSYRDGSAEVVPKSVLTHDNHEGLCWREFADLAAKSAKDYRPAWQPPATNKTPPQAAQAPANANQHDLTPKHNHPLNKLALAMLKRWSRREMPELMPVLELALEAVPEDMEDGPEGQAFDRARRSDPEAILEQLSEAFQPEDLLDATNVKDAGQMILNELMASGEVTDSQLYREAEGRDD